MVENKSLKKKESQDILSENTFVSGQKPDNVNVASKDASQSKMSFHTKRYFIIGTMLVILLVAVLGVYLNFAHAMPVKTSSLQNINIALKWVHQSQFAGNYVAQEKGFYAARGLNATLIPYNFKDSPIDLVASGKVVFGIAGADEILLARSKGIPVKAVAVIYQINPVCAFSLKSSGIKSPTDFVGKRIGIEKGINVEYEYDAMMENLHINRSNTTEISIGYNASELLDGTVDISTGYVINEPYYAIATGQDVNIIMVEDYGVNMYADVLFTTDYTINSNPKLVDNFVQATLDGWQYTLEHEDEAVDIVMHYAVNNNLAHERYALHTSLPLINTGDVPIGYMDEAGWNNVKQSLLLQKRNVSSANVSDCYTTKFINNRDARHNI